MAVAGICSRSDRAHGEWGWFASERNQESDQSECNSTVATTGGPQHNEHPCRPASGDGRALDGDCTDVYVWDRMLNVVGRVSSAISLGRGLGRAVGVWHYACDSYD